MPKKTKRIFRQTTPEERQRIVKLQEALDKELPELALRARQIKQAHLAALQAINDLKAERERRGLSLTDVRDLSGIQREALCKLENSTEPNPTIRSLARYADALNLKLNISFAERTASSRT